MTEAEYQEQVRKFWVEYIAAEKLKISVVERYWLGNKGKPPIIEVPILSDKQDETANMVYPDGVEI